MPAPRGQRNNAVGEIVPGSAPSTPVTGGWVDPLAEANWDGIAQNFPGCSVFHSRAWANVLAETYGYRPRYWVIRSAGVPVAVLPLFEVDSWLTGRRGVSLPFSDECPILAHSVEDERRVVEHALALAREKRWRYLELRGMSPSSQGDFGLPWVQFYGHKVAIDRPQEELFGTFKPSVRRAIRRSEAANVQVTFGQTREAMLDFYRLHCLTRQRHGVPPQPLAFFMNIHRLLVAQGQGFVALASAGGSSIAGAVFLIFRDTATFKFGASDQRFQAVRANNLTMWGAIGELKRRGLKVLSLGRTDGDAHGLRQFKNGWGSTEYPIVYHRFDGETGKRMNRTRSPMPLGRWLLQRLPLSALQLGGKMLYRHIG